MKNTLSFLLPFVFATFPLLAKAQTEISIFFNDSAITVSKDTIATLTGFTGKYCEGKTYLQWNVACEKVDGVYIIYKSSDGIHFELLGHKKGVGVPISAPIAYCIQDDTPQEGTTYYQLIHIAKNKTYLVSEKITVTRHEILLAKRI